MKRKREITNNKLKTFKKRKIKVNSKALTKKKNEALKALTKKDEEQYKKYKQSFFKDEQINFIFNDKKIRNPNFVKKLLKSYIIDIAVEAKNEDITCREVVNSRQKNDKILFVRT